MATKREGVACYEKAGMDEPLFVLRGQDILAAQVVRYWSALAEAGGTKPEIVAEARECADKMTAWPFHKHPGTSVERHTNLAEPNHPHCCFIGPEAHAAEFIIIHGAGPDEYTHSCSEHVGALLTDAKEHRIYPLPAQPIIRRPELRHPPVAIECRCDGNQVYALIGPNFQEGVVGFGDNLPEALRALAVELYKEVGEQPDATAPVSASRRPDNCPLCNHRYHSGRCGRMDASTPSGCKCEGVENQAQTRELPPIAPESAETWDAQKLADEIDAEWTRGDLDTVQHAFKECAERAYAAGRAASGAQPSESLFYFVPDAGWCCKKHKSRNCLDCYKEAQAAPTAPPAQDATAILDGIETQHMRDATGKEIIGEHWVRRSEVAEALIRAAAHKAPHA